LGNEWRGWQIVDDRFIPPNGRGFTRTQLAAYEYVWQLAHEANRDEAYALLEKLAGD
jgi:hypothetical protein